MSAHTPLPWSEGGDESSNRIDIEGPAPEYRVVATLGAETPRRKADAALILRAVNAHEELVAALEAVRGCGNVVSGEAGCCAAHNIQIDAALNSARGVDNAAAKRAFDAAVGRGEEKP